jgi:ATP phosphoribosyltransferase regulatory subunit
MAGATLPLRLYYNANVFRRAQEGSHNRQQEFYQAGVELLGTGGLLADAETLLLLIDCLDSLKLQQWTLVLGEAGLTRSLLASFPLGVRDKVRWAIAHLDRNTLETLPLTPELREQALMLLDLRGRPSDVLQRVASLKLDAYQRKALDNLKSLIELLQESYSPPSETKPTPDSPADISSPSNSQLPTPDSRLPLILDLSLIRTFDYYTGVVFEVVSPSTAGLQVLGQGGRYDQLLGLYHPQGQSYPGIGFSLQIEQLHQVLLPTGQLPQQTPHSEWLVVPDSPQTYTAALNYAQTLRNSAALVRVEVDLGGRTPAKIYDYAHHRRITQIAWVKAGGETVIETVNHQS